MGNIVTTFRNNMFDASNAKRSSKNFLSKKHQSSNRLIMLYFYSTLAVVSLQYLLSEEEKKVAKAYHSFQDQVEKDKLGLTVGLTKAELENMNY